MKMSEQKLVVLLKKVGDELVCYTPEVLRGSPNYARVKSTVKRNLNSSFGAEESPNTPPTKNTRLGRPRDITLVINKKEQTSRFKRKYFYYESCSSDSENEKDTSKLIVTEKRKLKTPVKYSEDTYISPIKTLRTHLDEHATPVKNKLLNKDIFENVKTPKRTPRTPRVKATPKTPRSTLKLFKDGAITPKVQARVQALDLQNTPLKQARSLLHVSYVPDNLPCREKEYLNVMSFLEGKLLDKCGGCMYISGVPGTGKTATVTSVLNQLKKISEKGDLPEFQYISINGMKLTEPRQAYVEIMRQIGGKTVTREQAQNLLEQKFTKKSKKTQLPIILLVDELDIICTKRQDVVYNLLDWPTKASCQLIVITIANTMDLPERLLMNRVTSRLGLTRLTFQPYTHKQLQEIVTKRLVGTNSFNPDAVQFVARKVASVSGDARRALDICRRSAEIAELEGDDTLVAMNHVNEALQAMITQPKVRAIKNCSRLEQYLLQAVISEVERTGIDETVFPNVYKMLVSLSAIEGFNIPTTTVALRAVSRLNACKLLLVDSKSHDLDQRIIMNVSSDDVYYALKEE